MIIYFLILLLMTLAASFAGYFIKISVNNKTILKILINKYLYLGGFLYISAAFLNIYLLQKLPYLIVVPLGSLYYIWTLIIARIFLNERINIGKIIGISLILAGVVCIAISK